MKIACASAPRQGVKIAGLPCGLVTMKVRNLGWIACSAGWPVSVKR
jgi:hypothetical protein